MTVLVTGGTGVAGQFIVEELRRRGQSVRMVCRPGSAERARALGAEVAIGDLGDPASLAAAARGVTGIVHAACTFTDRAIDVAAMQALLAAWVDGPFVFISSLDVYGVVDGELDEDAPLREDFNDYATGKVICERLLAATGRADQVALRAPYIWGPHPSARRRLLERLERPALVLPGVDEAEWSRYRDAWIDTRDLAVIVAESLARPAGGPLNVLTGHYRCHDLYQSLIRLTGDPRPLVHKPLDEITDDELDKKHLHARTWRFSEARLARHLGAIPRRSFDETLRATVTPDVGR